jgi:hypothetical protein
VGYIEAETVYLGNCGAVSEIVTEPAGRRRRASGNRLERNPE